MRLTALGATVALVGGVFSVIAVTVTPSVAGATTTPVTVSWSSTPTTSGFVTATPPAGTVSATVTLTGGGGGGGGTDSNTSNGGPGGEVTGTFALTHSTGQVAVELGGGGGGGHSCSSDFSSCTASASTASTGFEPGGAGGQSSSETASVQGAASGGAGGAASGLYLGSNSSGTEVAVAGGGGGGGGEWGCDGDQTNGGAGGAGDSGGSGASSAGATGGTSGDSEGGGSGGAAGGAPGAGAASSSHNGGNEGTSTAGGDGGGAGPSTGQGGQDHCTTGEDASGGGGGGGSVAPSPYDTSVTYNSSGGGGSSGNSGGAGAVSLTWNVDNLSVTSPGTQSNTSGTAISNLTITAPHDTTGGNSVTFGATGLPAGLSISSAGVISGTPTTACACSVTVTATDSQALSASTTFTWNITNTVTVTNPGNQSSVTGSAITPLSNSAHDSSSTATVSWTATGLPAGLTINSSTGTITGTPTTPGSNSVTITATDGSGYHGSASFTWAISNTVAVTNPGTQSSTSGAAISNLQIAATDSQSGATLTFSATGLPAGLTISSSGLISGTPTTACACSVTVTATDGSSYHGSTTFTWNVTNTVTVANPGNQSSVTNTAISTLHNSASDSSSTATISSWSATGLPAGLTINSSSGAITGTPTAPGSNSVTIKATDSAGYSGTSTFTWTITNTVAVTNPGTQSSASGTAISNLQIAATDTQSGATLTFSATGLPAGLSISSSGLISGTPTTACACSVTVTATDGSGYHGSATFTWNVTNTITVTNPGSQTSQSGTAISPLTISARDSASGVTLSYSAGGTLPAGLSINSSTGVISGTPTTGGLCSVTITVTDGSGASGSTTFNWTVNNVVTVTSPGNQSSVSGTAITPLTISASDSSSTTTLSYSDGGTLPTGLSINASTGVIHGAPTTAGTYSVTITATDTLGYFGTTSFTWTVTNTVTVTSPGNQSGISGTAITPFVVAATDSSSTATLAYSDGGTLPPGLSIDVASGTISGTPTTGGTYTVIIAATDGSGASGSATFTWTVTNTVSVTSPGDQSSAAGTAITPLTVSATDTSSTATLSYSDGGTLPPGLSIDSSSGQITGTPTTAGSYPVTITASDNQGFSGTATFTWTVTSNITVTNPGAQTDGSGTAITPLTIQASDSSAGSTLSYSDGGTLPPGLSIDSSTGKITGTPTTGGAYSVTITVSDNYGQSSPVSFTWTITNTVSVSNPGAQTGVSGTAISPLAISASDSSSTATLTYSDGGTLPAGLAIDPSSGVVSGTPTTGGSYPVTITATDGAGYSGSATFTWTVTNTVSVTGPGDQSDVSGTAITPVPVTASDSSSTATLAYSDGGTLPPGLSVDPSSGVISGTPTNGGSYAVTLNATDNAGFASSESITWVITNVITVTSPGDQSDVSGTAISPLAISASDSSSTATLTYSDGGTLPPGLAIDPSAGIISGTPTTGGSYPVTITVSDGAGYSGSASFTWTITNTVSVTSPGDQSNVSGTAISPVTVNASDSSSTATLTYSDGGTLPPGLSIDPNTGTISGTPTTAGSYSVTITATDDAGYSSSASFTWTITNSVTVTSPGDQSNVTGTAITPVAISASDSSSSATLTYSDGGTLPPGLSIDPNTGTISGTPTTAGSYSVTITATDGSGASGSTTFTWTITNTVTVTSPGDQSNVSGTGVTPVAISASDSSSGATLTYSDGGTLPPGLSIDPNAGTISGTPTTAGSYPVTITATDGSGASGSTTFTWTITNTVSVTSPGNQLDDSGTAISPLAISASDSSSTASLTYSDGGTLPPGLSIDPSAGVISGNPTTGGTYAVTITATDGSGASGSASFTWTIHNVVTVNPVPNQSSDTGSPVTPVKCTATDSQTASPKPLLDWTATGLPPGLSIDGATANITGTPTAAGTYSVTVTATERGMPSDYGSTSFTWTVVNVAPTITSVSPNSGPGGGGTKVKISGTRFTHVTAVMFGSVAAERFKANKKGTKITAYSPAESAGTVDITVTAVGGTSSPVTADQYTFGGPSVTGVNPSVGNTAGGTTVKVSGSDMGGVTAVDFGSVAASSFSTNSKGTQLTVVSPAQDAGTVDIVVTTPGGTSAVNPNDQFTYAGPSVSSVSPDTGPTAGGTKVDIFGGELSGATAVHFGLVAATSFTVKGQKIVAIAPAQSAGAVDITVTTPAGTSGTSSADEYTYG